MFDLSRAAFPIADGARYDWIEPFPNGERHDVTFRRVEGGYEMAEFDHPDEPVRLMFVEIADTPEDDYVAQVNISPESDGFAYAFLWRTGDVFRVISAPGSVEPGPKPLQGGDAFCEWRSYRECHLVSAEDVLALYRAAIYPRFVAGQDLPGRYSELVPHALHLAPRTDK